MLTGITGYLGIHLLHELLENTTVDIYCPIREKDNLKSDKRFEESWNYFFPSSKLDTKRVHLIVCDITKENYGLSTEILDDIKRFWESEERYKQFGNVYKRNILLYSLPGNGKTSLINILCHKLIDEHDGVVIFIDIHIIILIIIIKKRFKTGEAKFIFTFI
jgi:DNA replication protein DnaC